MKLLQKIYKAQLSNGLFKFKVCLLLPFLAVISLSTHGSVCSPNWKITGYYSPIETDFPLAQNAFVHVQNLSRVKFNKLFLKEVKLEGWGKTRYGWYLGYFANKWHKSTIPLDSRGHHLQLGAVAIDKQYLKMGHKISIPQVNNMLGVPWFVARDTGSAIKHKHIDVYTGEGKLAKKTSWQVTGKKQVCITSI